MNRLELRAFDLKKHLADTLLTWLKVVYFDKII